MRETASRITTGARVGFLRKSRLRMRVRHLVKLTALLAYEEKMHDLEREYLEEEAADEIA